MAARAWAKRCTCGEAERRKKGESESRRVGEAERRRGGEATDLGEEAGDGLFRATDGGREKLSALRRKGRKKGGEAQEGRRGAGKGE